MLESTVCKKENQYLYALEGLAAIMVIFSHFPLGGLVGDVLNTAARVAVAVFFIISGRYLPLPSDGRDREDARRCRRKIFGKAWRLCRLTAGILAVYTICSFLMQVFLGSLSLEEWAAMKYNAGEWIQQIFFNSGKIIYDDMFWIDHLWYLFAVIYAVLIVGLLCRFSGKRLSLFLMIPLAVQLILIYGNLVPDTFVFLGEEMEGRVLTRNYFFTGLPFVAFGMLLQQVEKEERLRKIFAGKEIRALLLLLTAGGLLWSVWDWSRLGGSDMYPGTALAAMAVTAFSLSCSRCPVPGLPFLGKNLSGNIYFWHPLLGMMLPTAAFLAGWNMTFVLGDWRWTALVLVSSALLAFVIWFAKRKMDVSDRKTLRLMIAGLIACFLLCAGFSFYGTRTTAPGEEEPETLESAEDTYFYVKEIRYNSKGDAEIYAFARNGNIHYPYHNWTLGDGEGEYLNMTMVLVDRQGNIRRLTTYPYNVDMEGTSFRWSLDGSSGVVASVKREEFADGGVSLAAMFTDREGQEFLVWQEEEYEKRL